MYNKIGVTFQY